MSLCTLSLCVLVEGKCVLVNWKVCTCMKIMCIYMFSKVTISARIRNSIIMTLFQYSIQCMFVRRHRTFIIQWLINSSLNLLKIVFHVLKFEAIVSHESILSPICLGTCMFWAIVVHYNTLCSIIFKRYIRQHYFLH